MPSPIGHLVAGITVSLAADQRSAGSGVLPASLVAAGLLAASPDLDLLVAGSHRSATHSLLAVGLVLIATAFASRIRTGRIDRQLVLVCTLAYGTHLLTDYFGADPGTPSGIQIFWPWSTQTFISDVALFRATEREAPFSAFAMIMNTRAVAQELLILGPICLLALIRRRRLPKDPLPCGQELPPHFR